MTRICNKAADTLARGRVGTQESPARSHALRLVLLVALEREAALACLDPLGERARSCSPAGVYATLGLAALERPSVWCRCCLLVDRALAPQLAGIPDAAPATIAQRFWEARDVLSPRELAGMLWVLLREQEPAAEALLVRLSAELEASVCGRSALPAR